MRDLLLSFLPTAGERTLMSVGAFVGAGYTYLVGDVQEAFLWLCAFMLADICTGIFAACKNGEWCSKRSAKGIVKKCILLWIVALGKGLDVICGTSFLQAAIIGSIAVTEFGSVIENLCRAGYTGLIPESVQNFLAQMKERPLQGSRQ